MNAHYRVRLNDMLDAALKAQEFTKGKSRDDLNSDDWLSFGVVRALEIVDEAASRVSNECRDQFADIEWKAIIGMRNKIIHDYISVDNNIVWDVVIHDPPILIAQLKKILF